MKRFLVAPLVALTAACMTHPTPPPILPGPPGGTYRAVGTEPFWDLTIDPRQMTFTDRGNDLRVAQPTPRVIVGIAGEIYQTPRLNVNIVHQPCNDGMSDRTYRDRVQVTVDGRRFEGCGGDAENPGTLTGTNWRVSAVNGRATPTLGAYYINFEETRFAAKFGCNGMGADYRREGNTIFPGQLVSTRMACPDMSFETAASVVLSLPLQMEWRGGDRLRLSAGNNRTIDLVRSY